MNFDKQTLESMRDWLKDCVWADMEPEDFDEISDERIARGVASFYDGGIKQFLRDGELQ